MRAQEVQHVNDAVQIIAVNGSIYILDYVSMLIYSVDARQIVECLVKL